MLGKIGKLINLGPKDLLALIIGTQDETKRMAQETKELALWTKRMTVATFFLGLCSFATLLFLVLKG